MSAAPAIAYDRMFRLDGRTAFVSGAAGHLGQAMVRGYLSAGARVILNGRQAARLDTLRLADAVVLEELKRAGLEREIWQSFAVLPVVRTVGVQGDDRTYAYPIILRAVTSDDAMTADWARIPYDVLERISSRVINEVPGGLEVMS